MRKLTKLLTLALAVLTLVGVMPVSAAFTDVSVEDDALYDAVELLTTLGVAKGTSDTTFGPDELVTRQQMAAFVYRLMKAGRSSEGGTNTTTFTDLNDPTFYNMISWASNTGIIKGRSATEFDPNGNIILQDAYVMLVRALGYENNATLNYPFDFIDTAETIGLDDDIPSSVDYGDKLTRGQVAILLANAFYADMNETTVEYKWLQNPNNPDNAAYAPVEVTETIAHKIFGVVEEKFVVTATTHYGFNDDALYSDTTDVDIIKGNRYDANNEVIAAGEEIEFDKLGLEGDSDDYFLAELTLFTKKDEGQDTTKDKFIAAKSNLLKKTVTAADVTIETSTRTDKEYYVGADKNNGDKVMTGFVNFGGIRAWLDVDAAPYSYKNLEAKGTKGSVRFIDLTTGSYDENDAIFGFALKDTDFDGTYVKDRDTGAYDKLTKEFSTTFPTVYSKGLYEADVYDINGDGFAEYVFVKDYAFTQLIDHKTRTFGSNFTTTQGYNQLYTKNATVEGEYDSEDFVLAYVNFNAAYVKVAETITPIESVVSSKTVSSNNKNEGTVTFRSGDVVSFKDAAKKFAGYKGYDIDRFTPGKSYRAYIKDGVILYQSSVSSGDFDTSASYAIVLPYDDEQVSYKKPNESGSVTDDRVLFSASGVVDGEIVTSYFVNAVIDGAVKAVKLSDYANTHYNWNGSQFSTNADNAVESQKITDKAVAEAVMYHDFLGKFSTYTVDSEGGYTFTAQSFSTDIGDLSDKEEEIAVYVEKPTATLSNYTGSIYSATGLNVARFNVRDYSKLIIKTVDDDGEDVYTLYTSKTLPKFDSTVFTNVKAIFVNNTGSTIENLGILYGEVEEFGSKALKDYRIVTGISETTDDNNRVKTVVNVLDIDDNSTASNIEVASGNSVNTNQFVTISEDGKAAAYKPGSAYIENTLFNAGNAPTYDAENRFLTFASSDLTYVLTDDTTIMLYIGTGNHSMVEADILTTEDNPYEEMDGRTINSVYVIAEDNDDDNDTIKTAKTIIVSTVSLG